MRKRGGGDERSGPRVGAREEGGSETEGGDGRRRDAGKSCGCRAAGHRNREPEGGPMADERRPHKAAQGWREKRRRRAVDQKRGGNLVGAWRDGQRGRETGERAASGVCRRPLPPEGRKRSGEGFDAKKTRHERGGSRRLGAWQELSPPDTPRICQSLRSWSRRRRPPIRAARTNREGRANPTGRWSTRQSKEAGARTGGLTARTTRAREATPRR